MAVRLRQVSAKTLMQDQLEMGQLYGGHLVN